MADQFQSLVKYNIRRQHLQVFSSSFPAFETLVLRAGALSNLELLTQQSCQRDTSSSPSRLLLTQTSSLNSHQVILCRARLVHAGLIAAKHSSHPLSSSPVHAGLTVVQHSRSSSVELPLYTQTSSLCSLQDIRWSHSRAGSSTSVSSAILKSSEALDLFQHARTGERS